VDTFSFSCVNNLLIKFLVQRKGLDGLKEADPEMPREEAWRGGMKLRGRWPEI